MHQHNATLRLMMTLSPIVIFDFSEQADIKNWLVVDDVVMGGESAGSFTRNAAGHGVFKGAVSLENNGGFSSVRYRLPEKLAVASKTRAVIKLKGDGKTYQFRIKPSASTYYAYIASFPTTGAWQEISIPLASMYPSFRGRTLDLPNFAGDYIAELTFLIGNKKNERFILEIERISLE